MITQLGASAFKSLKRINISPQPVNLLLGANGTGKTNFADLVEFVSMTARFGLREAFDRMEGLDEVRTRKHGGGRYPALSVHVSLGPDHSRGIVRGTYTFQLKPEKALGIAEETLDFRVHARSRGRPTPPARVNFDSTRPSDIRFRREGDRITKWSGLGSEKPAHFREEEELLLTAYGKLGELRTVSEYLSAWRVYNIDSHSAKSSVDGNDLELDRYGGNLISFLKRAFKGEKLRTVLVGDLQRAVPYVDRVVPETVLGYPTLKFHERDSGISFRAKQMSDGTVRLLGLMAVFRQPVPPPVVVIEEPENALHRESVRILLEIAKHRSTASDFPTQVFFTSHSSLVLDDLLGLDSQRSYPAKCFVSKREDGAATILDAPSVTLGGIAQNEGRPSEYQREGSFGDQPEFDPGWGKHR